MTYPLESSSAGIPAKLSALMDGEVAASEAQALVQQWQADGQARADWHAFQLIGDVLRSEDLASTAEHDARFLQAVRERLALEPVVLAPSATDGGPSGRLAKRKPWMWSSAAASTLLVAGLSVWYTQYGATGAGTEPHLSVAESGSGSAASGPSGALGTMASASERQEASTPAEPSASGPLLRDAQIDRYLAAHQQFVGTSALGVPSGFMRNAAVEMPRR